MKLYLLLPPPDTSTVTQYTLTHKHTAPPSLAHTALSDQRSTTNKLLHQHLIQQKDVLELCPRSFDVFLQVL